jgi:hypothetical protein
MTELMIDIENQDIDKDTSKDAWYTPAWLVDSIREILGSIDTDPCSCDIAQSIVKATTYYTKENSGLDKEWNGNVFMNPPYSRELYPVFVDIFLQQWFQNTIQKGIVLTRNNTDTDATQKLLAQCDNALFLNQRVVFWNPHKASGKQTDLCGHIIFLFSDNLQSQYLFRKVFAGKGFFLR